MSTFWPKNDPNLRPTAVARVGFNPEDQQVNIEEWNLRNDT